MEKTDIIYIGIVVLLIGSFAYLASQKDIVLNFQTALSPESYVEFKCEDVEQYKSQGYTYLKTDEHGCEVVHKCAGSYPVCSPGWAAGCNCAGTYQGKTYWLPPGTPVSGLYCSSGTIENVCSADQTEGGYTQFISTCQYDTNDLLAVQSFHGGQSIKKSSTQYPVKRFCPAHSAIWINSDTKESGTSTVFYEKLDAGETLDIPANEVWTLFYILENNYQLPTQCKGMEGMALNTETQQCVASTGIVYTCQQGQFDPAIGSCVVQPETSCSQGRLVKHEDGTYECVYTPPLNIDCSPYGNTSYYSVNLDVCVRTPEERNICNKGTYDSFQDACLIEPEYKCSVPLNELGECATSQILTCEKGQYDDTLKKCVSSVDNIEYYCVSGMMALNPITNKQECQNIAPQKTVFDCRAAGGTLEASTGNCIFPAPIFRESPCGYGTTWDASINKCIAGTISPTITKEAAAKETKSFLYKYWHWILLLLVAAAVIVYFRFFR